MKKTKNRIVAILLAMLAFAVSLAAFGFGKQTDSASALSRDYHGEPDTIYYFFDYYPETTYSAMADKYPEYNIVYDRIINTPGSFIDKVENDYFSGFGERCMVIIDIKTFVPDAWLLEQLFQSIKEEHSGEDACTTMFITTADEGYYDYDYFTYYVDTLIYTDFGKLEVFLQHTAEFIDSWYYQNYENGSKLCILIDGNTVLGKTIEEVNYFYPFLTILFEQLSYVFNMSNVTIVVNTIGNYYVSVYGGGVRDSYYDVEEIMYYTDTSCVCAIGFWSFEQDFYQFLLNGQNRLGAEYLPVCVLECDPFEDTGSGLVCTFPGCFVEVEDEIFGAIDNWKRQN